MPPQPRLAEPLGAFVVLFTALFEDDVTAVAAHGGLAGFQSLLDSAFCDVPHDIIVPGALTAGDLSDVATALAPRSLWLDHLVDGRNRLLTNESSIQSIGPIRDAYAAAGVPQ